MRVSVQLAAFFDATDIGDNLFSLMILGYIRDRVNYLVINAKTRNREKRNAKVFGMLGTRDTCRK